MFIIIVFVSVQVARSCLSFIVLRLSHVLINHRIQIEKFEYLLFLAYFHSAVFMPNIITFYLFQLSNSSKYSSDIIKIIKLLLTYSSKSN